MIRVQINDANAMRVATRLTHDVVALSPMML